MKKSGSKVAGKKIISLRCLPAAPLNGELAFGPPEGPHIPLLAPGRVFYIFSREPSLKVDTAAESPDFQKRRPGKVLALEHGVAVARCRACAY